MLLPKSISMFKGNASFKIYKFLFNDYKILIAYYLRVSLFCNPCQKSLNSYKKITVTISMLHNKSTTSMFSSNAS